MTYTIFATAMTQTIAVFTTNTYCDTITYAHDIPANSTLSANIISFDDSTRVITVDGTNHAYTGGWTDNKYGDTTYAVTITGTNTGSQTNTITFNIIVIKDCTGATLTLSSGEDDTFTYQIDTTTSGDTSYEYLQYFNLNYEIDGYCEIQYVVTFSSSTN